MSWSIVFTIGHLNTGTEHWAVEDHVNMLEWCICHACGQASTLYCAPELLRSAKAIDGYYVIILLMRIGFFNAQSICWLQSALTNKKNRRQNLGWLLICLRSRFSTVLYCAYFIISLHDFFLNPWRSKWSKFFLNFCWRVALSMRTFDHSCYMRRWPFSIIVTMFHVPFLPLWESPCIPTE